MVVPYLLGSHADVSRGLCFPEIEGQLAAYKSFCELWIQAKWQSWTTLMALKCCSACTPLALASDHLFKAGIRIFEYLRRRAQFGIEMDFTPVIYCQDVVDYHKKLFAKMS